MKFKCKTCQTELNLWANESECVCSKCGRKHSASEAKASIEEQIQNREVVLTDLKKKIQSKQGEVTDSSSEVNKIKTLSNYLIIALVILVISFLVVPITINRSENLMTISGVILGAALIASLVLLGKICAMGMVDSILFSAEECKKYSVGVHIFYWFLAYSLFPIMIYGVYKLMKNIKALDPNSYRSGQEIELSDLSRRSFELQKEIESLRAELNN